MINQDFTDRIEEASLTVGKTWPLYSFVTSNPLSGYEGKTFEDATAEAKKFIGVSALPQPYFFRQAWESGKINKEILEDLLQEAQLFQHPEYYLAEIEAQKIVNAINPNHELDRIVSKWLGVFLDEGMSEWEMPERSKGFYKAWRNLASHDNELNYPPIAQIPETASATLLYLLEKFDENQQLDIFKSNIGALPGYTGYIKYRMEENSAWQQKYPITIQDYLAVRLWIAKHIYGEITVPKVAFEDSYGLTAMQHIWLKAWEKTFQNKLIAKLKSKNTTALPETKLQAQLVFCIDTRSEMIRRHIEQKGNYETFGYAGFFGLATDYKDLATGLVRKSCPPIVASAYTISEMAQQGKDASVNKYIEKAEFLNFSEFLSKRMKNMLPSAFGYVEGAGLIYGFKMLWRTLFPATPITIDALKQHDHENICQPQIHSNVGHDVQKIDISIAEKVAIVKSAFDLLGWEKFAPIVVFVGHASHSANNPFASSLDCGACAASPGRHNARMLAKLANLPEVRTNLSKQFNIQIPVDTLFIGAEHDTTTDGIVLFDAEVPNSHLPLIQFLKEDLIEMQKSTINERLGLAENGLKESRKKSANWAETRPEWGLAGNAGFIIGPRNITKHINLESSCFLHSYDWKLDESGTSLETIMQGPMVVTQWINNHYYFSTVNNEAFGGGSKITHNVIGRFGVVQGNGGDLKFGLPLQSVNLADKEMFHQPLRLSVVIQAPLKRVAEILDRNSNLKSLLNNKWIYLVVMDPQANDDILIYANNGQWTSVETSRIAKA